MSFVKDFAEAYQNVKVDPHTIMDQDTKYHRDLHIPGYVKELESLFKGHHLWRSILWVLRTDLGIFATLGILLAAIAVVLPYRLQVLFSRLESSIIRQQDIIIAAVIITILIALRLVLSWYQNWRERRLSLTVRQMMMRLLFKRLQIIDVDALRLNGKAPLTFLATYAPQLSQVIYVIDFAVTSITIVALIVTLIVWIGIPSLLILTFLIALILCLQMLIDKIGHIYYQYVSSDQHRVNLVERGITEYPTLKSQYLEPQFLSAIDTARTAQVSILHKRARWQVINRSLEDNIIIMSSLVLVGIALVFSHLLSSDKILALLVLLESLLSAIQNNLANYRVLRNTVGPTHDIEDLFCNYPPIINDVNPTSTVPRGEIRVERAAKKVMHIAKGARLAVVGKTGVGKSTFLRTLASQTETNDQGLLKVSIGGAPILVERNQPLFEGEIAELITVWQRPIDHERYEAALNMSGLASDLANQQDGDARYLQQKSSLSEGQIQRLSLARALYEKPDVLLLDDIFASINPELAHSIGSDVLGASLKNITRIFVTSRIEMVHYADYVLVMGANETQLFPVHQLRQKSVQQTIASIAGDELAQQLAEIVVHSPQETVFDRADVQKSLKLGRKHVFKNVAPPLPADAFDTSTGRPIRFQSLWNNAQALFPPWSMLAIMIALLLYLVANIAFAALIAQNGHFTNFLFLALFIILLVSLAAATTRYSCSFSAPIAQINRLHRLLVYRLLSFSGEQPQVISQRNRLLGRLTQDFSELEMEVPNSLVSMAASLLDMSLYVVFLFITNPYALLVLIPFGAFALHGYRSNKSIIVASSRLRASVRGPVLGLIDASLGSAGYRLSSQIRHALLQRFITLADVDTSGSYWSTIAASRVLLFVRCLSVSLFLAVLWPLLIVRLIHAPILLSVAPSTIIFLAYIFAQRFSELIERLQNMDTLLTTFERLSEILDREQLPSIKQAISEDVEDPLVFYTKNLSDILTQTTESNEILQVCEIAYGFSDEGRLFDNVSLQIKEGEHVALTGPSGIGKTTIARIISGNLTPQVGYVLLKGQIPNNSHSHTRENLVYLVSKVPSIQVTIRDFLDPFSKWQDVDLIQIFNDLGEDAQKWMTNIQSRIDEMSLGEQQVLNLIRGLLLSPVIIVLDEATSGLDSSHERRLLSALLMCRPKLAIFAILHRADNLDVFDHFVRLEQGNHQQMLKESK